MGKTFEHIIDILAAIIIIFIFPILYFGQKQDAFIQTLVEVDTSSLLEEIRGKGYLTTDMYDTYLEELARTGLLYDVDIKLKQQINEPEYRLRSVDEVIDEQDKSFQGPNVYHYVPVSTSVPTVTEPDNSGIKMNDETNESVLAKAVNTPADPNHVHTPACYAGHVHTGTPSFTHVHAHSAGSSCTRYVWRISYDVTCRNCGEAYNWLAATYIWDNGPQSTYIELGPTRNCMYCNSSNLYVSSPIYDYGYSCAYIIDEDGDGFYDEVPSGVYKNYPGYSDPQNTDKATYTSGCYTYHRARPYTSLYTYYDYTGEVKNMEQAFRTLLRSNLQEFCTIPEVFECKWYNDSGGNWLTLAYMTKKQPDGQILYDYLYCIGYSNYSGGTNTNPGFPSPITQAQLLDIMGNTSSYMDAFKAAIDERYSGGSLKINMTGSINMCEFDHSLGVNKWITSCGLTEDKRLVCDKKVTSITATHPIQAVYTNEALITTVRATYVDGSTKVVLATTTFQATNPVRDKTVTLEYTDATGNKVSCTIHVTVVPRNKTCANGHTYNLNSDGSDPGCPYCRAWLRTLSITYPSTGSITIYKGTSLSDHGVELLATYLDGHTERVIHGYVDNLDSGYVGTQNVTISYKGKYVTLTVITKRNLTQCSVCHRFYELYPDGTDPGCPYCAARTPIFTGKVMTYYNEKHTAEILNELYDKGSFYFTNKDYLTFDISNRINGIGGNLISHLFRSIGGNNINVIGSGYIRENGK